MRKTSDDPSSAGRKSATRGRHQTAPNSEQMPACTFLRLRQLARSVEHYYDAELKKAGLRTTQYILLSEIIKLQPVRPRELARAMKLDQSTLSRNLRPLNAAGWVEFTAGLDGRCKSVRITDLGRVKHIDAHQRWRTAQNKVNELLGVERMAGFYALIDDSMAILSSMDQTNGLTK